MGQERKGFEFLKQLNAAELRRKIEEGERQSIAGPPASGDSAKAEQREEVGITLTELDDSAM